MNISQNLKEKPLSFRSEIGAFDIFLKRSYVESFEDLQNHCQLKMNISNAYHYIPLKFFYLISKALFVLKIFPDPFLKSQI